MKVLVAAFTVVCFSFLFLGTVALASPPSSGYHLVKSVPLGTAPGDVEYFDYVTVDPVGRRVYLAHGTEVKVLDADNFTVVGSITGLKRSHGDRSRDGNLGQDHRHGRRSGAAGCRRQRIDLRQQ